MTDPIQLTTASPRLGLPLLFSGQAQKEFFVNEALMRLDTLTHTCVEGLISAPPATPEDGQAWVISSPATGTWAGKENQIAASFGESWLYIVPQTGMRIYNRDSGQFMIFDGDWQKPATPSEPMGGQTIDTELRASFVGLVASLRDAGIFPDSG